MNWRFFWNWLKTNIEKWLFVQSYCSNTRLYTSLKCYVSQFFNIMRGPLNCFLKCKNFKRPPIQFYMSAKFQERPFNEQSLDKNCKSIVHSMLNRIIHSKSLTTSNISGHITKLLFVCTDKVKQMIRLSLMSYCFAGNNNVASNRNWCANSKVSDWKI